jgi:chromosome segregation ATPase
MAVKGLTVGLVLGLFAWETVQAASISTRVRVLENKVSQFERQVNKERADQSAQVEQVQKNTHAIEALKVRVDQVQSDLERAKPEEAASGASYLTDRRFTDSRYSYP